MVVVDIYELDAEARPQVTALVAWDGTRLVGHPADSPLVRTLLGSAADPDAAVRDPRTGRVVDPAADPLLWLNCLQHTFKSPYLTATAPRQA